MLETDEVDEDFFTPISSTTLANIFQTPPNTKEEDSSLKYVPPKPSVTKPEESKTSDCIFACALFCYEWYNNVYAAKGKVGFAIMKILKTGQSNILLYDSNKVTLSCTTIQSSLKIKVKGETYISFYDNASKYWSLCGSPEEIKNITEALTNLGVEILPFLSEDKPQPNLRTELKPLSSGKTEQSDTDSSANKRTKASILSRMASMGQSILPPQTMPTDRTSDSSDTCEAYEQLKVHRHKPTKNVLKKAQDKSTSDVTNPEEVTYVTSASLSNKQILPMPNTHIFSTVNSSNDIAMLMAEQRINNSELRINMGRISDIVDQILDKVNGMSPKENASNINTTSSSFQNEIYQKLLNEYERKICAYEELIRSKGLTIVNSNYREIKNELNQDIVDSNTKNIEIETLKKEIADLESVNKTNEEEIKSLRNEIQLLHTELNFKESNSISINEVLTRQVEKLKKEIQSKKDYEEKYQNSQKELEEIRNQMDYKNIPSLENKIKAIMNDTFQTIAANFNNDKTYSGETVKNTVATIIKKLTLEVLKEK